MEFVTMGWENQMGSIPIGFVPSDLTGLKLWTRFNSGITVTGSGVAQWDDVSGEGNHLLQGTDANRPSKEADGSILFDGGNDFLKAVAFTWNQPETVYILFKQVTWTSTERIYDGEVNGSGILFQNGTTPKISSFAGTVLSDVSLPIDTYGVIASVFNSTSSVIQLNSDAPVTGNAGSANMGGFTLGSVADASAGFSNIQVMEVIGYSTAHDAAQRLQMYNYLAGVGGL